MVSQGVDQLDSVRHAQHRERICDQVLITSDNRNKPTEAGGRKTSTTLQCVESSANHRFSTPHHPAEAALLP